MTAYNVAINRLDMPALYWTAGFLEGEGSFRTGVSIGVFCSQVQTWPLERLQTLFGGSISSNGKTLKGKQRPCSVWYINGYRAAALMMTLYSLMSPKRQTQIAVALARWKGMKIAPQLRNACPRGHPLHRARKGDRRYCPICQDEWQKRKRSKTTNSPAQREMFS